MTGRLTPAERADRAMSEAAWQSEVIRYARMGGWMLTHSRPGIDRSGRWSTAIQGDKGWPDLALLHLRRRLFVVREVKTELGKLTPEQRVWLDGLVDAGVDADVWRPSNRVAVVALLLPTATVMPGGLVLS